MNNLCSYKFTQGDYRRFCVIFYAMTRRLMKFTEFILLREKKKRVMPRHLLTAAVLIGIIPENYVPEADLIMY